MPLLEVENLKTYFHTRNGIVRAVDGISFSLEKGDTLGIVGESGSGKSVSCYSLLRLIPCPPGRIESGHAKFGGLDLLTCSNEQLRQIRGKRISMIFQDPMTSLNPYLTVGDQLMEPLLIHEGISKDKAHKRVIESMDEVGILDPEKRFDQYPHEFSGGMKQRVMIAMALITKPEILIADEPTTALDVTVQAQILDLIAKLQKDYGTAVIFITHDLGVIASISERALVMYAGKIVEKGPVDELFANPKHPYTKALLDSIPARHKKGEELFTIPGLPPDVSKPMPGCSFTERCTFSENICTKEVPVLQKIKDGHESACLRLSEGIL